MKNPKILYISCHEILEYDECKLLTEMGYEVRSVGAYSDPHSQKLLRPPIPKMERTEEHIRLAGLFGLENKLEDDLINWADVIIFMHKPEWIWKNIYHIQEKFPSKVIVYRSIGQSVQNVESMLHSFKHIAKDKFKIIRYSPCEINLGNYAGEDSLIRFYKDPEEFNNWKPDPNPFILLSCQAASTRGDFCHMQEILDTTEGFPRLLLGQGNQDLNYRIKTLEAEYEEMKSLYRKTSLFIYSGTLPACYTLSFLETFMTGTPIVAIDEKLWRHPHESWVPEGLFEIPMFVSPFSIAESWGDVHNIIQGILDKPNFQTSLAEWSHSVARQVFNPNKIMEKWSNFFKVL